MPFSELCTSTVIQRGLRPIVERANTWDKGGLWQPNWESARYKHGTSEQVDVSQAARRPGRRWVCVGKEDASGSNSSSASVRQ